MAALNTYNYNLCVEICAQVAEGKNIKDVLKSNEKYPTFQTWCNWKRLNKELFDLYISSIQDKSESIDAQIDEIMVELKGGLIDPSTARVMIDTLKWKAAKYYPKMFGDKVDHDITSNGKELNNATTVIVPDKETADKYQQLLKKFEDE